MRSEGGGMTLELRDLRKLYGSTAAVHDASLSVNAGEFVTLLGPSGSGKTTTLNMVAGFIRPTSGQILLSQQDISHVPTHKRDIGVVFQGYMLFPHMTVAKNVEYPLARRGLSKDERRRRTSEALDLVHLSRLADRRPGELSGGEQQRVALARAIVFRPPLMLMDEPLGALDKKLRENLQWEIKRIQQETGITCLYVTHDQEEALALSDRIAVFDSGTIEQVGSPQELYERPATIFTARFLGESNCLTGPSRMMGERLIIGIGPQEVAVPAPPGRQATDNDTLMVRPERMSVSTSVGAPSRNMLRGRVGNVSYLGSFRRVQVVVPGSPDLIVHEPPDVTVPLRPDDPAIVSWDISDGWVIPRPTGSPSHAAAPATAKVPEITPR